MKINQQKIAPYLFLSPFLILFIIFGLFPILYTLAIAFFKWRNMGPEDFVLFQNFTRFFKPKNPDKFFFISLTNTFTFILFGSISQHFFAVPLALLLNNKRLKGRNIFKTIYFLPIITGAVSITMIFSILFSYQYGLLNYLLKLFGFEALKWRESAIGIKISVSIMQYWRYLGFYIIMYLAGLQAIPAQLYESAKIDGAGTVRQFTSITLPMLVPIIFFGISLSIIFGIQLFVDPYFLSGGYPRMGGPENSGFTSVFHIMLLGFKMSRFGRASAVTWLMFVAIWILILVNKIITDNFDYTKDKGQKIPIYIKKL